MKSLFKPQNIEETKIKIELVETKDLATIQEEILLLEKEKELLQNKVNIGRVKKNDEIIETIKKIANDFSGEWKCTISLSNPKIAPECQIEIEKTKDSSNIKFYKKESFSKLMGIDLELDNTYYTLTLGIIDSDFIMNDIIGNCVKVENAKKIYETYIDFVDNWSKDVEYYIQKEVQKYIDNIILHSTKRLEELKKEVELLKQYE